MNDKEPVKLKISLEKTLIVGEGHNEKSEGMADAIRGHLRKGFEVAGIYCHFVLKRFYKKRSTSRRKNTPFAR